jgi:hypothetical protein
MLHTTLYVNFLLLQLCSYNHKELEIVLAEVKFTKVTFSAISAEKCLHFCCHHLMPWLSPPRFGTSNKFTEISKQETCWTQVPPAMSDLVCQESLV